MARSSFVCNARLVGLWLGLWLEVHLFVMLG